MEYLDDLEEAARQGRVMASVVRRFLQRGMTMALNQWTGLWKERQRFKQLARRMGADGGLGKAWRHWVGQADQQAWLKGCVGRFAKHGLSKAYNRWLEALEEIAAMRRFAKCARQPHTRARAQTSADGAHTAHTRPHTTTHDHNTCVCASRHRLRPCH